ncbi:MAG TPA: NfeD family protein [Campylobacterales bacterium]|nr:NfeD family protein [Campylobacterales bacterium]
MVEFLSSNLIWWHWIVLGLILVVSEIFAPLFIVLWFGLSAIIVGLVDLVFATSFMSELFLWIVLSVVFLALWFMFFKDKTISKSGQSDFTLATKGIVTQEIKNHEKGKVRFDSPVLGSSEWFAVSEEEIEVGTPIHIVDVKGQLLKVKKD